MPHDACERPSHCRRAAVTPLAPAIATAGERAGPHPYEYAVARRAARAKRRWTRRYAALEVQPHLSLCQWLASIRAESWCELLNLLASLLSFATCVLPYTSDNLRVGRGFLTSAPLSISLLNLLSMLAWLTSAMQLAYAWRRDRVMEAREQWEAEMERQSGVPRAVRAAREAIEREAEQHAARHAGRLRPSRLASTTPSSPTQASHAAGSHGGSASSMCSAAWCIWRHAATAWV